MLTCETLITALVVSREPGHELLCLRFITSIDLGQEVVGVVTTQCGRESSLMKDLNATSFPRAVRETQVACVALRMFHCSVHSDASEND